MIYDDKIKMSEVYIDSVIKTKYAAGDIVVKKIITKNAQSIYSMLSLHNHMSVEDVFRIIFKNTSNSSIYVKDISITNEDCYCSIDFSYLGYIQDVVKQGNWLPEYTISWEERVPKNPNYKPNFGLWGQEFIIGLKHISIMSEEDIKKDVLGNAWKFLPENLPTLDSGASTSAFTNNIKINFK